LGWYWKGRAPHSWATEHYGYWKCGANKVWSWYPGPYWIPQIVELRSTDKYIGWRSGEVDDDGNFVEQPIDRFSKTSEWTFVTLAQFANPITPDIVAPIEVARAQLEDSTDSHHTYLTYRVIERPGPHPADFAGLKQDGGMLPPVSLEDEAEAQAAAAQLAQAAAAKAQAAANSPAAKMTGTNQPTLLGQDGAVDPSVDRRKVKYWITMSLPTFWTKPPDDATPNEIYIYRPDFYQDQDGIERRITLWFNPNVRTSLQDVLASHTMSGGGAVTAVSHAAAIPAEPAEADPASNPFRSPLDDSVPTATEGLPKATAGTNGSTQSVVPSGRQAESTK
jgi:hypothetical protein